MKHFSISKQNPPLVHFCFLYKTIYRWCFQTQLTVTLPIFDDAEIKTGKVASDEGLEDTDNPASIKLAVSISHLQTHTHTAGVCIHIVLAVPTKP